MKYLLDTHILLWAAAGELPENAMKYVEDESNNLFFSPASIWEVVIKNNLNKDSFNINPALLYRGLLNAGYIELPVITTHTLAVDRLPMIHKDPFDRILIAQAVSEDLMFLTADDIIARYPGPIIHISK